MNDIIISETKIQDTIYEIRGKQVMLDSDLAKLYQCKNGTKDINKAVKRNINRFPEDFYFQLTKDEYNKILRFQFGTLKIEQGKYSKYIPHVFTEEGVSMLSSVLHTVVAEKVSIDIMRAFVSMRKYISSNLIEQKYINNLVLTHEDNFKEVYQDIKLLQESFDKLEEKKKVNEIFLNGQIYDAYSKIIEIFSIAKKELIIIDTYADNTLLNIIKKLNIKIIIITKENNLLTNIDISKYNKQYQNLTVIYNNTYHDRYFIIDKSTIYHCGTSINRIGYKTFSITLLQDKDICNLLIENIDRVINKKINLL